LTGLIWLKLGAGGWCFAEHGDEMGSDYFLKKDCVVCGWLVGLVGKSVGQLVLAFVFSLVYRLVG
jgi:hypothetical protein